MKIQRIQGQFEDQQVSRFDGLGSFAVGGVYDWLQFRRDDGKSFRVAHVMIPEEVHDLLGAGLTATYHFVEIPVPKLIGSRPVYILFALEVAGVARSDISGAIQMLKSCKWAVARWLWFGLLFLPAFGLGLLFWLQAFRMMRLSLPETAMAEVIKTYQVM